MNPVSMDRKGKWLEAQKCRSCFYAPRIGIGPSEPSPCQKCGGEIVSPRASPDRYCLKCADSLNVCKRCGAPFQ